VTTPDCPLINGKTVSACPLDRCMHNVDGNCKARIETDSPEAVAVLYGVSSQEVLSRADMVCRALAADTWFEHATGRGLTDGTERHFAEATNLERTEEFNAWNTSSYTFPQIISVIEYMRSQVGTPC
jgi:hypothetical protein